MPESAKALFIPAGLSGLSFLIPYLNGWGGYSYSEFLFDTLWFIIVIGTQLTCLFLLKKYLITTNKTLGILIVLSNIVFFTFFLTNWSKIELIAYLSVYVLIYILLLKTEFPFRAFVVIIIIQIFVSLLINWGLIFSLNEGISQRNIVDPPGNAQRSIYIIGMDSMVSRQALSKIYGLDKSAAYEWLVSYGFSLHDITSPGDQTLTSFANLLTANPNSHPRTARRLFNGQEQSVLYLYLTKNGFKRQFIYENDYFGLGPGNIESFLPTSLKFSSCDYKDKRWGYFICNLLHPHPPLDDVELTLNDGELAAKINYYTDNIKIGDGEKWFSISHIWFPGHTIGRITTHDFIDYYIDAQPHLKSAFIKIVSFIKRKDPDAVILFFGDHGAYALRPTYNKDNNNISQSNKLLDSRSVLAAVHPKTPCHDRALSGAPENILLEIAKCNISINKSSKDK